MTSKLKRERLEELAAGQSGFNLRIATHEESQELARMALAAMDSEPVAWRCVSGTLAEQRLVTVNKPVADFWRNEGCEVMPLYHHAPPAQRLESAGWQFKSVNGDWLGLIDERGKNQAVHEGCEVREVFAMTDEFDWWSATSSRSRLDAAPMTADLQTRALVMWIKRLSLALRSASPDNKLPKAAMGYLQNNGLISIADCLRGNNEEPPA
ncbi:hypothetical protein [Klebsiella spallanzanii]|uniref:hypothetical protein n=1 Tax=Klebsiella spallanzanii TaxID=2587528 RepID=UPI00116B0CBD|nr:hypothetical protein [Klebsiella spallanzanii]VUS85213.1 hypothetical protein SB6419_04647 [Klebsiella spallanzanii]